MRRIPLKVVSNVDPKSVFQICETILGTKLRDWGLPVLYHCAERITEPSKALTCATVFWGIVWWAHRHAIKVRFLDAWARFAFS
ncbi:unnamed protein product [Haemonchus placei]|uniref:TYR_PHOSPHATASE_2 domain-containing protein n=1 Tax=Haemonchus placei TaxID=6290 RepID=A0A0N4WTK3_HAEPC|nr:unnamed protein product [Haemonchus placei]